jgi:DNA-binding IclR family transcriptional regulator
VSLGELAHQPDSLTLRPSVFERAKRLEALVQELSPHLPDVATLCARLGVSRATAFRYRARLASVSAKIRPRSPLTRALWVSQLHPRDGVSVHDLQRTLGVSRATAYRYLQRLAAQDGVATDASA